MEVKRRWHEAEARLEAAEAEKKADQEQNDFLRNMVMQYIERGEGLCLELQARHLYQRVVSRRLSVRAEDDRYLRVDRSQMPDVLCPAGEEADAVFNVIATFLQFNEAEVLKLQRARAEKATPASKLLKHMSIII